MKRLVAALAATLALAVPGAASAEFLDPGGGGGGGTACSVGMTSEGSYSGTVPYYGSNSQGTIVISTYPGSSVSADLHLLPGTSTTVWGPTYTTPWNNSGGVPFSIWLSADSDSVGLWAQGCI
jgi:hypothetical protein